MVSRYRLVAAAITAIFIVSACSGATPSSAPASVAPAPSATAAGPAPSASAAGQDFTGVTVDLLTFNGPQVAEPLQRRAPDFEALTGAKINVVAVGFQEIYDKAILDLSTGTNSFDAFVFNPQWLGDFAGPGYLEDLSGRVDERPGRRLAGHRAVLPRLQRDVRGQDLHDPAGRRLPHGLLPERPDRYAADDLGRVPHGRGSTPRQGPQRRRRARLRLLHRQEEGPAELSGGSSRSPVACSRSKGTGEGAFFDTATMQPAASTTRPSPRRSRPTRRPWTSGRPTRSTSASVTRAACSRPGAAPCRWTGATSAPWRSTRPPQRSRTRSARSSPPAGRKRSIERAATLVPCDDDHVPERRRRRELRPVRLVRWLVRRDQRRGRAGEEGRGLRVPRLHERSRPVAART